jgi:hypothetical protein
MQHKSTSPDPVLVEAGKTLPDPSSLTPTQRRAIRLARTQRLIMVRGGWKAPAAAGTSHVSFKTTDPLEALGLVRRVLDRARWTLVCTGAGMMLLDVIDARKQAGSARSAS